MGLYCGPKCADIMRGGLDVKRLPEGYPYKTGKTITWDGNTEGREVFAMDETASLVKVSDIELSKEQLAGAKFKVNTHHGVVEYNEQAIQEVDGVIMLTVDSMPYIVYAKNSSQFPDGLHFLVVDYRGTHQWVYELTVGEVHTMAEEFMPLLTSPDGTKYKIVVSDAGALSAVKV